MKNQAQQISQAVDVLDTNLSHIARVAEWSDFMGYENPQQFAYKFLRHYKVRPLKVLDYIRLKRIVRMLKSDKNYSNLTIAHMHSLPDEKALNNFTNYHLGCAPTDLKRMSEKELNERFQKFGNKIQEQI